MSNSPLVTYTRISNKKYHPRNHVIDTITIHCYVGQVTAKQGCDMFATTTRSASCNYVVGKDGSIGLCVDEADGSWCTSSASNDHRAVTIEVASDTVEPYAITDKAYTALVSLVADICKRNNIKKLVWSTNKNERVNHLNGCNMTVHRDYAAKSCPGNYIYSRLGQIANEVNKKLNGGTVKYQTHVQNIGWQGWVSNGQMAGTTGKSLRMEAIKIDGDANFTYQVHVQNIGDMPPVKNGQMAGTEGKSLRMESIKIDCDKKIQYRVHVQNEGWTGWVSNGAWCGTKGKSLRLEAIEIKFV